MQLAVLQSLAAWREEQAQQSNRPRRWILKDEVLLDLARQMPADEARLRRIRGLEEGSIQRHGASLLRLIGKAKQLPKEQWPTLKEGRRLSPEQEPLVDMLMALLRKRCQEQRISPSAVAGRRDLEQLILGKSDIPLLHGWRAAIAGETLRALLQGELTLGIERGRLVVLTSDGL